MRACVLCGANETAPLYPGIVKCRPCGHAYADLDLDDEQLAELYRRDYFFGDEYSDYLADEPVIRKNFALRLRVLDRFLDPARHRRLFEIGSAYGFFLDMVRDRFPSVSGIDITEDGARHARERNLDVAQGDFVKHDLDDRTFDVVCFWDTLEHLRDPHLYLEKVARHTETGALVTITTGDIASLNARLAGKRWRQLHPPTHLHYFNDQGLRRLLGSLRFEIVYDRYCGFYRSVDFVAHNLFVLRWGRPWIYRALKALGLTRLDFYLNMYDIRYLIARRR